MYLTLSVTFKFYWIVPPGSIRSFSGIILRSSYLNFLLLDVISENTGFQVNLSSDYFYFTEMLILSYLKGLVVELKLQAVSTVKLLPFICISIPKLPCPVQILYIFNFLCHQQRNIFKCWRIFGCHEGIVVRAVSQKRDLCGSRCLRFVQIDFEAIKIIHISL